MAQRGVRLDIVDIHNADRLAQITQGTSAVTIVYDNARLPVKWSPPPLVRIPGLEVHIPRGVILRSEHGHALTSLTLTPMPLDRPPFPVPEGAKLFFTTQAHGAKVESVSGSHLRVRIIVSFRQACVTRHSRA